MKTDQAFAEKTDASVFDLDVHIQADDTKDLPDFEYNLPVLCQKMLKTCNSMASASNVLITNKKRISSYVGPSKLFLVMKGMKIHNMEVTTIKFIGNAPRFEISAYITRRPNIEKVITDSYGPVSCTWSEFETVRKNLTSFVVCSGDGFIDMCDFIQLC